MKENSYQSSLIKKLKTIFIDCIILKNDCNYKQGIPDLTIYYRNKWCTLEVKQSKDASHRPNQDYYVKKMNDMSFSKFIYPENEDEVINELKRFFLA